MSDGTAEDGTTELLEVAYRFGLAVVGLAIGAEPLRPRLMAAGRELADIEDVRSGLWPEPHLPAELADQVDDALRLLTADGPVEVTVAAMDDAAVARAARQVTVVSFALHQAVGATGRPPA